MAKKTADKKRARELQERTYWSYAECLRCVRDLSEEQIEALIKERSRPITV